MGESLGNILIIQTAFIGDAVLTLPLIQTLKEYYPQSSIDVVVVPRTAEIFSNHPAISDTITFDKRGKDTGIGGLLRIKSGLRSKRYDLIIVPHRSLRSAILARLLKPERSIGFDRSAGRWLFTDTVHYDPMFHEIDRNLSLLGPLKLSAVRNELPHLYPSIQDIEVVDSVQKDCEFDKDLPLAAVAPGTIWNTKKWPEDKFASVCRQLSPDCNVILIGGEEDSALCRDIVMLAQVKNAVSVAGKLSLLQSAELISRCKVLISNDSAPMHLAVAVGTPVIAIFGATVPEFGFAPRGPRDVIVETKGLKCRPCSIHGGKKCPIKTFDCMMRIEPGYVADKVRFVLQKMSV